MECIKGAGLITKIKSHNSFSQEDAAKMIKSLISAVHYFHELRIIHRDLNPETIIAT
jgi:serine/threonine protein kinase